MVFIIFQSFEFAPSWFTNRTEKHEFAVDFYLNLGVDADTRKYRT